MSTDDHKVTGIEFLVCADIARRQQLGIHKYGRTVADNPLPEGPFTYRTAEQMDIRVEVLARIEYPMALTFLPDRSMLVVTRKGELFQLAPGSNTPRTVAGGPPAVFRQRCSLGHTPCCCSCCCCWPCLGLQ